jgi:hypothetical protein
MYEIMKNVYKFFKKGMVVAYPTAIGIRQTGRTILIVKPPFCIDWETLYCNYTYELKGGRL